MSDYGRTWEKIREMRVALKRLLPDADLGTLAHAKAAGRRYSRAIGAHLHRWEELEREAALADGGKEPPGVLDPDVEAIAALFHEQWVKATRVMLCFPGVETTSVLRHLVETPYADLTDAEKKSARESARKALALLRA
jgi:hypothetical protein